jgi:hypothetical protein
MRICHVCGKRGREVDFYYSNGKRIKIFRCAKCDKGLWKAEMLRARIASEQADKTF